MQVSRWSKSLKDPDILPTDCPLKYCVSVWNPASADRSRKPLKTLESAKSVVSFFADVHACDRPVTEKLHFRHIWGVRLNTRHDYA